MDLVGPGEVFIGRGDNAAVGVFQPIKAGFQTLHRNAAQIDDVAAHGLFIGRNQRLHHVAVVKDDVGR